MEECETITKKAWAVGVTSELHAIPFLAKSTLMRGTASREKSESKTSPLDWKFLQSRSPIFRHHMAVLATGPPAWTLHIALQVNHLITSLNYFPEFTLPP